MDTMSIQMFENLQKKCRLCFKASTNASKEVKIKKEMEAKIKTIFQLEVKL